MTEYKNKTGEVPVGELYEKVILDDGTEVIVDETIVSWDEPDLDERSKHNGHRVNVQVTTGIVDKIYKRPKRPEISIRNADLGKLRLTSNFLDINESRADRFLSKDAEGCVIEYWFNGMYDIEVR